MSEWFAADQDDIDLGASMRAASSTAAGFNVSSALGAVQGVTNTVSGLVRTLYQTRSDIARAQIGSALDVQRGNTQLQLEAIRARQLAAQAATPAINIGGLNLQMLMPLLVIGAGALIWKRLS